MGSKLKEENPGSSSTEISKLKLKQWKQLPEAEKRPYLEAQAADQQRHAAETAAKEAARQQAAQAQATPAMPQPPQDPGCSAST